jgi:hypothetical protein
MIPHRPDLHDGGFRWEAVKKKLFFATVIRDCTCHDKGTTGAISDKTTRSANCCRVAA